VGWSFGEQQPESAFAPDFHFYDNRVYQELTAKIHR
jgi:hypothetical protein